MSILIPRLHLPHRRIEHSIDYLGSALLTVALAALVVLATAGGKDVDWVSPESGALALVLVACGVAFVWRERHAAEPFVPLRLFQNPVLRIAAPVNFTSGLLFYLGVFFLPVFFQEVAGVDATESGLLLIPFMIGTAVATTFAGRRVERTGRYRAWPIVGGVAMTVGVLALTTVGLDTAVAVVAGMGADRRHRHRLRDADVDPRGAERGRSRRHGDGDVDRDPGADARRHGRHTVVRRGARGRAPGARRHRGASTPTRCRGCSRPRYRSVSSPSCSGSCCRHPRRRRRHRRHDRRRSSSRG